MTAPIFEPSPVCPGSNLIIHETLTDGAGVLECPVCRRWAITTRIEISPQHRTIDAHPARRAPRTHTPGAIL